MSDLEKDLELIKNLATKSLTREKSCGKILIYDHWEEKVLELDDLQPNRTLIQQAQLEFESYNGIGTYPASNKLFREFTWQEAKLYHPYSNNHTGYRLVVFVSSIILEETKS